MTTSSDTTHTPFSPNFPFSPTVPIQSTPTASSTERAVIATGLIAVAGVHLADLPGKMAEVPYLGWMYVGLIAACVILADLVVRRADVRLLAASAGLSLAVLLGFIVNRTVGMPNAMDDIGNWTEPLGLVSMLVESVVIWVGARAWLARRA